MAIGETSGWYNVPYFLCRGETNYPTSIRIGLFSGGLGSSDYSRQSVGNASGTITFRPVIWNE